jgi:hypothetical protein
LEERKVYYTSGPALGYLQIGAHLELRMVEVFILRKAAAGKQRVQKKTWQLAVQNYSISCQCTCGQRPSAVSKEIAGCRNPGKGKGFTCLLSFPSFYLSPGFLIISNITS